MEYIEKQKKMSQWCSDQGFKRWGMYASGGFWFYHEENYAAFLLRWT